MNTYIKNTILTAALGLAAIASYGQEKTHKPRYNPTPIQIVNEEKHMPRFNPSTDYSLGSIDSLVSNNGEFKKHPPVKADINGDGLMDLILTVNGESKYLLRTKEGKYVLLKNDSTTQEDNEKHAFLKGKGKN